ncbi:MAG TPA: RNA polymerase sigma factor [Terriglobales bacterium]|nr:RNA polymerase sigma factor [Terriglobales bacterium]HXY12988.1 RNA polymerase sigma factor [Terriglobales bacterium]
MPVLEQDSELLQQFANGDPGAFERLFRDHQTEVYRWVVRIVRDPAAAEDLTIETFWRIHRAHARFDPQRSFSAWARRIATNAALDHLKSRPREVALVEQFVAPASSDPVVQKDVRERTQQAFCRLPAKLRIVATLALIEELSYKEIADALGISAGAVKVRVFRAVRQLRSELTRLGVTP